MVSVGTFKAGSRWNIIAEEAVLTGTVRTLDTETWSAMPESFERIVKGVCDANRATYDLEYERIAPPVENDDRLADFARTSLVSSIGPERVFETPPIMASEDFAYFQQKVPGVFLFLGVANAAKGWTDYVHTPTFRPDEDAIATGVTAVASLLSDFTASGNE